MPRISTIKRLNMTAFLTNQENGLIVFDATEGNFYFWRNNGWVAGLGLLNILAAGGDLTEFYPNPVVKVDAITNEKIIDNAISTSKISDGAVTGDKLEDILTRSGSYGNEFTVLNLSVDENGRVTSIDEIEILINSNQIKDLSILNEDIADNAIDYSKLSNNSVFSETITNGEVKTVDIANLNVTTIKLADESVETDKIAVNAVNNEKIANDAVKSNNILDGEVKTVDIANLNVTTIKLADESVVTDKIAVNAITTQKIANDAITKR